MNFAKFARTPFFTEHLRATVSVMNFKNLNEIFKKWNFYIDLNFSFYLSRRAANF